LAALHKTVTACLVLTLALGPGSAFGGEEQGAAASAVPEGEAKDPCRGELDDESARLDRLRQGVFAGVCSSSRWFDGLFGDARDYAESYNQTYGRVGVGVGWDELEDVSLDGHFRANVQLPALGDSFNAVIGRETEDTYINDNFDDVGFLPGSFSDDRDAEWYAGLNYRALEGTNSRFDVSAGVQVQSPINPYVKARYRYYLYPADRVLVTTRVTTFWENENGFGVTLAADSDWSIRNEMMLRWANTITRSETTDGARWKSRLTLYHALSAKSAMRYELGIRGETGGVQPDRRELKVTYRRSLWREWFFLEAYSGLFWADDEDPAKRCDACGMAGVGFELMFGERYDSGSSEAPPQPAAGGNAAAEAAAPGD
jgi:hypothetical protein